MAQLLSDNSQLPLRLSIFEGETKGSNLYAIKEFGFDCLLYSLKNLLDYGDIINIIQSDETNRKEERKETPLFDIKSYNEAIVNAILHNKWVDGNEPMITVYSNRIEILSRGTIAPSQTLEGFYLGESVPVNEKLSEIFAQLRISDKSGRGVPKIVENYSRNAFEFRDNSIVVTIPFNYNRKVGDKVGNKIGNNPITRKHGLNLTRERIISEMRHNPNITKAELVVLLCISMAENSDNRQTKRRESKTMKLMDEVLSKDNLNQAFLQVTRNKGAAGVDEIDCDEVKDYLKVHGNELINQIKSREYQPLPARRVEIPKPNGGVRKLGIPTVVDRIIQQALVQKMTPIFEPTFSEYSYGFRPNRRCQNAIDKVLELINQGYEWIVDIDLKKFFDNVPQDKLIRLVDNMVNDSNITALIHKYLRAGVMVNGTFEETNIGTPQ